MKVKKENDYSWLPKTEKALIKYMTKCGIISEKPEANELKVLL